MLQSEQKNLRKKYSKYEIPCVKLNSKEVSRLQYYKQLKRTNSQQIFCNTGLYICSFDKSQEDAIYYLMFKFQSQFKINFIKLKIQKPNVLIVQMMQLYQVSEQFIQREWKLLEILKICKNQILKFIQQQLNWQSLVNNQFKIESIFQQIFRNTLTNINKKAIKILTN